MGGWPFDVALAVGAALVNLAGAVASDPSTAYEFGDGGPLHLALAGAGGLVLLWRRSSPLAIFAVSTTLLAGVVALEWQVGLMPVSWLAAAYALGAYASARRGLVGVAFAVAVGAVLIIRQAPYFDSWLALGTLGQLLLVWLLGCTVHARRVTAHRARVRALEAARASGAAAEEAALGERRRVARELHDSVTNSLSVVAVQAAAIRREFPGVIDGPLAIIEELSRSSLADLRRMLGALRGPAPDVAASHGGCATQDDLESSVARATGWVGAVPPPQRWSGLLARDWPVDLAFGMAVAAINVTGSLVADHSVTVDYREPVIPVLVLLAAAPGIALVFRRRHALAALAVALVCLLTIAALDWQTGNLPGTVLVASFAVAAWAPIRSCVVGAAAVVAAMTTVGWIGGPEFDDSALALTIILLASPWLIGGVARRRRVGAENAVRDAEIAERDLAARRARAITDERLRVAEDLTDLVAHSLAAVVIQTAAARQHASEAAIERRLAPVEEAGRAALDNLRTLLGVLRGDSDPDVAPAPGLDDLADLVETHRHNHGPIELHVDPAIVSESASLRLVTYRIVQEALTNIGRHAPGAAATVTVGLTLDQVEVLVEDDGCTPVLSAPRLDGGLGLIGMRERVNLHGGHLELGPATHGGFRVRAQLERRSEA